MKFDSILGTVGNTPVVRINKLAPKGVNLYVKIEAFNPLGSVKDRLALGVIEAAEKYGALKPGQTVIEATSGNTGIGLAMVCAAKGYPLVVTDGRELLGRAAQADALPRRQGGPDAGGRAAPTAWCDKAKELAATNGWFHDAGSSRTRPTRTIIRKTTAQEILNDFDGQKLDYWVTGFGTGGTLQGRRRACCARSGPRPRSSWPSQNWRRC